MSRPGLALVFLAMVSAFAVGCGESPAPKEPPASAEPTDIDDGLPEQDEPPVSAAIETPTVPPNAPIAPAEPTAFDRLCKAYVDGDADGWAAAEQEILKAGAESTPSLVAALNDGAEHERELAASLLAQTGAISPQAKKALRKALNDESKFVRANAVAALCASGDSSDGVIKVVTELFDGDDVDSQVMAVVSIGNLGEKAESFVPKITALLDNEDAQLRQSAAMALGQIGPKSEPALEKLKSIASDDPDEGARESATSAIASIQGEEPKAPIEESGPPIIPASSSQEVDK